jgi:hypothetical protein
VIGSPPTMSNLPALASQSIFRCVGDELHPTGLATGPWYGGTQHGSAMLGLLARAVEQHPSDVPMQVGRLTVDMLQAAPMSPVTTQCRSYRKGKSVEIVEASLRAEGIEYARASAMRLIVNPIPIPAEERGGRETLTLPDALDAPGRAITSRDDDDEAFHQSLELRPVPGLEAPILWIRFSVPLIEGEEPSPLVRVAVASDFTYSAPTIGKVMRNPKVLMQQSFVSINPDTTLSLHRPLIGEWVALDARAYYGEEGAGSAAATLHDEQGVIGSAFQSLLVRDPSRKPPSWKEHARRGSEE